MNLLSVKGLTKRYPSFTLSDISFVLPQGRILGLIGKNGAGKTTALKSILNLVRPDSGEIGILGQDFMKNEQSCKQEIGVVLGEVDFYKQKKLSVMTAVTKRFYKFWDEAAYEKYIDGFGLDESKRISELSSGMKVKYNLALALSHNARLLILDEPTSGLDPVSRDDLLGLFRQIVESGDRSILFSTHITSDLEKCADSIAYIKDGRLLACNEKAAFIESFGYLKEAGEHNITLEDIMIRTERRRYDV